ncbi:hypothetical protein [Anaerosporomusa subterranea]|nr:hypothetical protein [Anaerosporomusa subterranea]
MSEVEKQSSITRQPRKSSRAAYGSGTQAMDFSGMIAQLLAL